MRSFLLILFCFPFVLLSQNKHTLFAEGGASSFVPLEKNTNEYRGDSRNSFTFNSSTSAFGKIGLERIFKSKKQLYFSINFGLGFREQTFSYSESGFVQVPYENVYLCYRPWYVNGHKKVTNTFQMAMLFFGPKLTYTRNKWSFSSALNLNTDFVLRNKFSSEVITNGESYFYAQSDKKINLLRVLNNLSLQNIVAYKVSSTLSIGISCDISFLNISPFNRDQRRWQHFFNTSFGSPIDYYSDYRMPHVYSSLINTGIRLQHSF